MAGAVHVNSEARNLRANASPRVWSRSFYPFFNDRMRDFLGDVAIYRSQIVSCNSSCCLAGAVKRDASTKYAAKNVMTATNNVPQDVQRKRGYRRLADFMAWDPAMAIFPRFQAANLNNLLLMQAEICELEEKLNDAITADDRSNGDESRYSCDWLLLKEKGTTSKQWKLCLELREKLAAYNEALAHQIALNNQAYPHPQDMKRLRRWLVDIYGGASQLKGPGNVTWFPPEVGGRPLLDHLTLASANIRADNFSMFGRQYFEKVLKWMPSWLVSKRSFLPEEGPTDYEIYATAESIFSFGNALTSFAAAVLILAPVIVLHFVQNANWRLVVIVMFSLCFTAMLVLGTNAERSQIFGATAAFVAVQVVYVGSALMQTNASS